jgi:hypothetical protein
MQIIASTVFGVMLLVTLLVIAWRIPYPSRWQYWVFRVVASLAAAAFAAIIPGLLGIGLAISTEVAIRGGGALAVFIIAYFFNPPRLGLSLADQAIIARHLQLIYGQIPKRDRNWLPKALSVPSSRLEVLYKTLTA